MCGPTSADGRDRCTATETPFAATAGFVGALLAAQPDPDQRLDVGSSAAPCLPEGDVPALNSGGVQGSRRFMALSAERMKQWMVADLSNLDLLIIQIESTSMSFIELPPSAFDGRREAFGVRQEYRWCRRCSKPGRAWSRRRSAACSSSTGHRAVQRNTFGRHTDPAFQVHKARHRRLPSPSHATSANAQAWELDEAQGRRDQELGAAPGT